MKNRNLPIIAFVLVLSLTNYLRLQGNDQIRPIQFVSILVMGMACGLLLAEIIRMVRQRGNNG